MTDQLLNNALTPKFKMRAANWDDVDAIVQLRNASSQDTRGTNVTAGHWQRRHWYVSEIDLTADTILVLEGDKAIAYAELTSESPYVVHELVGVVHPDYRGQGIGTQLVHWAENRAKSSLENAPDGAAVFIQNSIFDSNRPGRKLFETQGYEIVRDFVYLQIQMDSKPPEPLWPADIKVCPLRSEDWEKVGPALSEAFKDHWGIVEYGAEKQRDAEEKTSPEEKDPEAFNDAYFNSPGLCFVAWGGDQVVGSCLCNVTTVEYPGSGYIGSLSIRSPWRRQGIGLALILHALNAYFERGTKHVFTDTDAESLTKAYNLYQKAGMEIFRREHVYERTIRSGRDLVKRKISILREGL